MASVQAVGSLSRSLGAGDCLVGVSAGATHLLDEVHEAAAEAPGLVPVALQGVHGHLGCPLVAYRHDVDGIVQQGRVRLEGKPRAA